MARPALGDGSFSAISHPTRRAVLDLLREGERNVVELCSELDGRVAGSSQAAVSEHLAVLLRSGLVDVRRDGRERVYGLRLEGLAEVVDWLAAYGAFWDERLDRFGRYLAAKSKTP